MNRFSNLIAVAALTGIPPAYANEASCTFQTQTLWAGATQTLFQIQNTGTQTLSDWGITIEYPEGYSVVNHYQTIREGANPYTFSSPSGTPLQPGQTASFGFQTINSNHQPIELTLLTCGGVPVGQDGEDFEAQGVFPDLDKSSSLLGQDDDMDGVRDDIEQFIAGRSLTSDQAAAALQTAEAFQSALVVDLEAPQAVTQAAIKIARGIDCIYERVIVVDDASNLVRKLEAITFNTEARTRRYIDFNIAADGEVVKTTREGACHE